MPTYFPLPSLKLSKLILNIFLEYLDNLRTSLFLGDVIRFLAPCLLKKIYIFDYILRVKVTKYNQFSVVSNIL